MLLHEIRRNYSTEMSFEETTTNTNVVQLHLNVNFFAIFLLSVTLNARYGYSLTQFLLLPLSACFRWEKPIECGSMLFVHSH